MFTLLASAAVSLALTSSQTQPRTEAAPNAADLAVYKQHVYTLADPFMEGRGPGYRGNRIAAEYFEWNFRRLGLRPAFDTDGGSYMQEFTAGHMVVSNGSELTIITADGPREPLRLDTDFVVLGNSASSPINAEVVFVGYSLPSHQADRPGDPAAAPFASYVDGDDLTGKVALLLRFEPMDEQGRSRLNDRGAWSSAAAIAPKIRAALDRGAAGVIVVSPPGARDPRTARLETTQGTENWTRPLDVPAVMLSTAAAERLVSLADLPTLADKSLLGLRKLADQPRDPNDTASRLLPLGKVRLDLRPKLERTPRTTWNVAGVLPGKGDLAQQYVIIGGHFDHVGYGHTGGSRSGEYGVIHPGADDNASGSGGVLLAASILAREYADDNSPRRSIIFIGFSAEETGLWGSKHFIKNSPISASALTAMLNMDMIGRMSEGRLEVSGFGTAAEFPDLLGPLFESSAFTVKTSPSGQGPSDHATFYGAGVPVLHFFTGLHDQYHTPRDTADLINFEQAVGVVRLVCDVTRALAARPQDQPLTFKSPDRDPARAERRPSEPVPAADDALHPPVTVRFGVRPGYGEEDEGVLVEDVGEGTAAAEAGIEPGDLLIKWNGMDLPGPGPMMDFLREHKPGDIVDITLKRKGQELTLRVTLKSRDQAIR